MSHHLQRSAADHAVRDAGLRTAHRPRHSCHQCRPRQARANDQHLDSTAVTRRGTLSSLSGFLLAGQLLSAQHAAAAPAAGGGAAGGRLSVLQAPSSAARPDSCAKLQPKLAASFTKAVYEAVKELQAMPEEAMQAEIFRLRDREYPYYYQANKQRLPAVPDLSDMSGGLSNPAYFNFVSYIIWKVVARGVTGEEGRARLCRAAGVALLAEVASEQEGKLREAARRGAGGRASEAAVLQATMEVLEALRAGGYCCGYQVTWGSWPGGWPQDWMLRERLQGELPEGYEVGSSSSSSSGGSSGGGAAGEEAGSTAAASRQRGDSTSAAQQAAAPGTTTSPALGAQSVPPAAQEASSSPAAPPDPVAAGPATFQVKIHQPADIEGCVALRQEEDGFWGHAVSSMMAALYAAGGYSGAGADEYFYQDAWSGPSALSDRVLLLLGDPLQQVEVPFTAQTLVQNWQLG